MNKKEKNTILMDHYIKNVLKIGSLALVGSLLFLSYKSCSTKTQMASSILNSYLNKDNVFEDKTMYYKYKAEKPFSCGTYLTLEGSLQSKTTCTIDNASLIFYSGMQEEKIFSLDKLTFELNSSLLVTQLTDFFKNNIDFKVKVENATFADIILNNGMNISKEQLSESSKKDLEKLFNEFKNIDLNANVVVKTKDLKSHLFNINLDANVLSTNWGLKQNLNFDYVKYDTPKEILFKDTVSEHEDQSIPSDSITESKIVLPSEIFVNQNNMAFTATKTPDSLIDIFYTYYKLSYEAQIDKRAYNQNYLNLDIENLVDINVFKVQMKELTSYLANEYTLSVNAPLTESIKNLFQGNYGSCYKMGVKDPMKNISIQYLIELIKKDPLSGNNISAELFTRDIVECTKSSQDCFKKCEF